jgi:ABC-type Fe2+-enterobactin transport system substrate-binding protein
MTDQSIPRWRDIVRALRAYLAAIEGDDDAVATVLAEVVDQGTAARTVAALIDVGATLARRRLQDASGYFESWIQVAMLEADAQDAEQPPNPGDRR